ncbi:uncharacterized protein tbc1d10c [Conger conger]|uniref:uncharacterized protein tbc1d10c n=1 Tax=Conger conger TaxID=82655 RepID=UPI002A59AC38|nr:uncharacterized protein tbc1d10c [Conger conger]
MEPTLTVVDPNNEDCSSSDNRSLLSIGVPAMETDRFGFILGTGSPVGTEGPPPEVVRQREAKWLNIISQWDRILLKKTNKVKEQCRKGIPASLRARCWPLLCRATERMSKNSRLYQTLDSSPALQSWVDVIERDIDRQFPFHEMFLSRDGHGQQGLFRVLKAYTQFRPDEGYCQGQGPVAAVLLMNMPAEEAFWCLVQISEQCLPGYYSPLLEGVLFDAGVLNGVLRRVCPAAHRHLHKHDVEPLMFATDWLMCLYTRHLPFNTLLRVWDLFFCYGVRVLFQVAVVLVRRVLGRQDQREKCEGQMETLERLRGIKAQLPQEDDSFIEEVCSVPLTGRDLERETERELKRWRKEHPSSTFDPRCRCHGYRAAWLKGRESEEQQERAEREKGNLSLPLLHSPSSLSPSLRKRWKRGSRVEAGEREEAGAGEEKQEKLGKAGEAVQVEKLDVRSGRERCRTSEREEEVQHSDILAHRTPLECRITSMAGNPPQNTDGLRHSTTQPHSTSTTPGHSQTCADWPQGQVGGSHAKPIPHTLVRPCPATWKVDSTEMNPELGDEEGSAISSQMHTDFPEGPSRSTEPGTMSSVSSVAQQSETETACPLEWAETVESPQGNLEQKNGMGCSKETAERFGRTGKLLIGSAPEHAGEDCGIKTIMSNQNQGIQEPQGSVPLALSSPKSVELYEQFHVKHRGSLRNVPKGEQDSSRRCGGQVSERLEDIGISEIQGGHSSVLPESANHSPAGDPTCSLTGQGMRQQDKAEKPNLPSPTLLAKNPKMEQTPNSGTEAGWEGADQNLSPSGCEGSPGTPGLDQGEESPTAIQIVMSPLLDQGEGSPVLDLGGGSPVLDLREGLPVTPVLHQVEMLPITSVLDQVEELPITSLLDQAEGLPVTPIFDQVERLSVILVLVEGEESPVMPVLAQAEESDSQQCMMTDPQLPTRAQSIREAVPFSSAHRATAGPKSETLPDDTGTELRLPDQAGQAERVVDQEETQPTGTDPTLPGGHLISPKDQGGPGQMPPPAEHCPSDEKCSGVYRPRRAPCGKASRSRTLSQDTFRDLNYTGSDTTPTNCLSDHTPQDISKPYDPANQDKTKPCPPSDPSHQLMSSPLPASNQTDPPRRFALFRMLRGDHQKDKRGGDGGGKDKKASSPKITVPTILIQDFSDGVGLGMPGDGLSSKERRKKRREQERRKREEEKARKKEKEMENEKDRERKKPQTRGKSFHAHSAKCDVPPPGDKSSKTPGSKRNSAPFLDTYF